MPTYVILNKWTQQGIENVKEAPGRIDAAKRLIREQGAELKGFYMTMGRYDFVAVAEAPDDATAARISLALGARGATRSETLRAFTEEEARRLIADLP